MVLRLAIRSQPVEELNPKVPERHVVSLKFHPTTSLDMLPAPAASHLPRRQHIDLQPLDIGRSTEYERRISVQSTAALPSPSVVAARAYLLQQIPPIGQNLDALQRRGSLFEAQQVPRRHSILAQSGGESGQTTTDEPPRSQATQATEDTALAASTDVKIKVEKEDDGLASSEEASEVTPLRDGPENDVYDIWSQAKLKVPFHFSHNHLREWGNEFLGNAASADAWVNAVSLRRPSLAVENSGRKSPSNLVTIRARVVPKSKDRKPLLITKQFDIEALRAAIPPIAHTEGESPRFLRRSSRSRRSSTQHTNTCLRRGSTDSQLGLQSLTLEKTSVPIHIEYATHYLPVLAALMLSGHVNKGDAIDLPLPSPESWTDTIAYIYTGKGAVTSCMRSNILHLAGHA